MIFTYRLSAIFPHCFTFEGLVFTYSDGVGVGVVLVSGIVSGVESAYNLLKIKNHSRKQRVSMGLTDRRKTARNLVDSRKN